MARAMSQTYDYRVRDRTGSLVTGQLVGDSETLVLARLREMGMTPVEVKQAGTGLKMEINLRPGRVKLKQIAIFCRQFATMVNSGLPILRALSILADQTDNKELQKVLVRSRTDVEQGSSLSAALAKHPKAFTNLFISMIKAGETGGVLDDVLLSLADQIEKEVELRRQIRSAMTYPVVVVALVMLILSAMLLFVVPQFETIYSNLGGTLPLPTRILLGVSDAFRSYWYFILLGTGVGAFLLRRYKRMDAGRARVDAAKIRIPVFGPLFHKVALARFASTLGMLLRAGVPILQALDNVKETVNNRVIAEAIDDVKASVREGESIAKPLSKHKVFPPMVVQMLVVGEETGAVDTMLDKVAQFYNNEVTAAVDALTSLIEPLLIAVIGGAVGAAVVALYMPMFNIINLIE
jgi:type IV pilus assembly protein PilC